MHLQLRLNLPTLLLTLLPLTTADLTTPSFPTPTAFLPPGETYVLGYPLCGIPGWTEVPGNYTETIEQQSGSDLKCCLDQCRASKGACKSIAFNANYTECLWFNQIVEGTQLTRDDESGFLHWDLECYVN